MKSKKLVFIPIFLFAVNAYASVSGDWKRAKAENTKSSYKYFLMRHPGSKYEYEAEWNLAVKQDSFDAYEDFLNKYPTSEYKQQVITNLSKLSNQHLMKSLKSMDVKGVDAALKAGADPNFKFDGGVTPLIYIAKDEVERVSGMTLRQLEYGMQIEERITIARMLIAAGARIEERDLSKKKALDYLLSAKPSVIKIRRMTNDGIKTYREEKKVDPELINLFKN